MKKAISICSLAVLSACAARPIEPLPDELRAHLDEPLICTDTADCNRLWRKAQVWVANNAGYKIQTATDAVVETFNAPNYSMSYAMKLTRVPTGGGQSERIDLQPNCGSAGICTERIDRVVARFRRDMRAAQ